MELECGGSRPRTTATAAGIRQAFADDAGRGEFIILFAAEEIFIQAAGEGDGPYALEYREGGRGQHCQCRRDVKKAEVETAFLKYLAGDPSWKDPFPWQPLEDKPWWKFW